MAIATSVDLILDDDDRRDRTSPRPRRGASPIAAMAVIVATVVLIVLVLAGCASEPRPYRAPSVTTMTPVYQSPYGPTVYQVDGPDGPEVITVVPGYQSPGGGPRTYHIIKQPQHN